MQTDIAENYSTFFQGKIQSAHWNETQNSWLTVAFWQNEECVPAAFVSNDVSHSKKTILICLIKIMSELPKSDVNKNFAYLV